MVENHSKTRSYFTRIIRISVLFTAGGLLYFWLKPQALLFQWLHIAADRVSINGWLSLVRDHLPDIFWAIGVGETAVLLRSQLSRMNYLLLVLFPAITEILQLGGVMPGTFDVADLLIYLILMTFYLPNLNNQLMKRLNHLVFIILIAFNMVLVYGSAAPSHTSRNAVVKPGFYGVTSQWNGSVGDIDGEVGHRLYVNGPRAKCISCNNCSAGSWSSNYEVISGSLPPGLSFGSGFDISGIPTDRGHWVIRIKLYNIMCNSLNYDGCCSFTQELRFHITGTGRVNN